MSENGYPATLKELLDSTHYVDAEGHWYDEDDLPEVPSDPGDPDDDDEDDEEPTSYAVGSLPVQYTAGPHKFALTQLNITDAEIVRELKRLADAIPDVDLAEDGREGGEDSPFHVTALYGIKG